MLKSSELHLPAEKRANAQWWEKRRSGVSEVRGRIISFHYLRVSNLTRQEFCWSHHIGKNINLSLLQTSWREAFRLEKHQSHSSEKIWSHRKFLVQTKGFICFSRESRDPEGGGASSHSQWGRSTVLDLSTTTSAPIAQTSARILFFAVSLLRNPSGLFGQAAEIPRGGRDQRSLTVSPLGIILKIRVRNSLSSVIFRAKYFYVFSSPFSVSCSCCYSYRGTCSHNHMCFSTIGWNTPLMQVAHSWNDKKGSAPARGFLDQPHLSRSLKLIGSPWKEDLLVSASLTSMLCQLPFAYNCVASLLWAQVLKFSLIEKSCNLRSCRSPRIGWCTTVGFWKELEGLNQDKRKCTLSVGLLTFLTK